MVINKKGLNLLIHSKLIKEKGKKSLIESSFKMAT